ncbi:MAG: LysM domain-containing protein [Desulfobacteraceae bacterium]|jgi:phage tail protein X
MMMPFIAIKIQKNRMLNRFSLCMLALIILGWSNGSMGVDPAWATGLLYKNYVVRYDRGWDILCEPYVVKKNDWVLKIFRQKGEIAHQNFRDFLGIFQRLNPHIKNINMIRPGQAIDIPIRKLEQGSLPGQATGVVTIPFVTLTRVVDVVLQHSHSYQVKRGDTVSQLIARHYGRYGTKGYREGIKLFQAANPQVENLDRIYAGQKLYLPDPNIREKQWYASMYDDKGELRENLGQASAPAPAATGQGRIRTVEAEPQKPLPQEPLAAAAALVGGKLLSKGTYYLPREPQEDFELDLSRHPMIDVQGQNKMLFTSSDRIMGVSKESFESQQPDVHVIAYDPEAPVTEIIASMFEAMEQSSDQKGDEVTFDDQGVHVAVTAKWIRPTTDRRNICISPIAGPDQRTPEPMRRYLEQNGVVLKEVLPDGHAVQNDAANPTRHHAVKNILAIAATGQKEFVKSLAPALGLTYRPNIQITFPYAGIQVKATANLISTGDGREFLVDFGDLYGDAVDAIRTTGLQIIQVTAEEGFRAVATKILAALEGNYAENPTFLAANRPAQYNIAVTIAGVLYHQSEEKRLFLSGVRMNPAVTDLLSANGVGIIVW